LEILVGKKMQKNSANSRKNVTIFLKDQKIEKQIQRKKVNPNK
jgi:hypothetical protein